MQEMMLKSDFILNKPPEKRGQDVPKTTKQRDNRDAQSARKRPLLRIV